MRLLVPEGQEGDANSENPGVFKKKKVVTVKGEVRAKTDKLFVVRGVHILLDLPANE